MAKFSIPTFNNNGEMRYQMGYKLLSMMRENDRILALDADLRSSTGLHIPDGTYPDRVIKVGIAEQNLIAVSAGLSQEGFIPFCCTFDAFSRRFMDQLYVSVCYSNLNVKILGAYAGLFTGKSGATHQSDKELGLLLRIPNLTIIEPSCNREMEQAMDAALAINGPVYLRLVRCQVAYDEVGQGTEFELGKGITLDGFSKKTADIGLVTTGLMLKNAKIAAKKLISMGYTVRIDHHPTLKPFDKIKLLDEAQSVKGMVTIENHCTSGGLFSLVCETLCKEGVVKKVIPIGTDPDDYIHTGHVNDLIFRYQMTSDDIVKAALSTLKK